MRYTVDVQTLEADSDGWGGGALPSPRPRMPRPAAAETVLRQSGSTHSPVIWQLLEAGIPFPLPL